LLYPFMTKWPNRVLCPIAGRRARRDTRHRPRGTHLGTWLGDGWPGGPMFRTRRPRAAFVALIALAAGTATVTVAAGPSFAATGTTSTSAVTVTAQTGQPALARRVATDVQPGVTAAKSAGPATV